MTAGYITHALDVVLLAEADRLTKIIDDLLRQGEREHYNGQEALEPDDPTDWPDVLATIG